MSVRFPRLRSEGRWFKDDQDRVVLLRGLNVGGDSKVPWPDGATWRPDDFSKHREVSFVNRPFSLDDADEHFARMRRWGVRCVRLLTTWEAIAHAGPGEVDQAWIEHYVGLCERAARHELYVIVDLHQDVFSRMTGGDGAPGWALEAIGFDLSRLDASDAAMTMQRRYDPEDPRGEQPERYPRMAWTWNYGMPANGVAWTLFFMGDQLLPELRIEGQGASSYLQGHFLAAVRALAERLVHLPNVVGFDVLNEPSRGWIGQALTHRVLRDSEQEIAKPGPAWSPLDALWSMAGNPVEVPLLEVRLLRGGCVPVDEKLCNPQGLRLWREGVEDPFLAAGIWEPGPEGPVALREQAFQRVDGREIDFELDALLPFYQRAADMLRGLRPDWLVFLEKDAVDAVREPRFAGPLPEGAVNASHWYDVLTLVLKRSLWPFNVDTTTRRPVFGRQAIARSYRDQLARIAEASGKHPTFIGEFGVPMDLDRRRAYRQWRGGLRGPSVWEGPGRVLELTYEALDALLLSGAQWNYTASNRNDGRIGDGWNQEDLSVYSIDQADDPDSPDDGGRALDYWVRPWAHRVQGVPTEMRWDREAEEFLLRFEADPAVKAPTEIVLPERCFPDGYEVIGQGLRWDAVGDTLLVEALEPGPRALTVRGR
ncbi:MAG: cellulase family glycosylhydrolase [Alphaproteobacteria bacterium]|nr:cellulase family glycosylhydrolase [Alphaproteobacteria bacterium]MCB9794327.1 cellulase family glycosylhydrolase [Alphaproteobacteria bacterium]